MIREFVGSSKSKRCDWKDNLSRCHNIAKWRVSGFVAVVMGNKKGYVAIKPCWRCNIESHKGVGDRLVHTLIRGMGED